MLKGVSASARVYRAGREVISKCRTHQLRHISSQRLVYSDFGDPATVLRKETAEVDEKGKLVVKMLASPLNPADINTIQGVYAVKPSSFPAVGGFEGVGVVEQLGSGPNPHGLKEGNWVFAKSPGTGPGTWQTYVVDQNENYIPVPKIDLVTAATLSVNPCTAYRMLKDFEDLKPGDTVIQNGGNSAVGQAVIQLCREFGFKSVSLVRNREKLSDLKAKLQALGDSNTMVLTDEELREHGRKIKAQLALNCVGGKSGTDILRALAPGRTMVTYGGMSRQPVIVPASHLIFNDIRVKGYWMTNWSRSHSVEARLEMLNTLAKLSEAGKFVPPEHTLITLDNYKEALQSLEKGYAGTKYIFKL